MSDVGERAKELFLAAADRPTADRDAYLDEACEGEPELERRVRGLLGAHRRAQVLEDTGFWPRPGVFQDELSPGERVGPYRLVVRLGEGGFGTVWRAEQEQPVRRAVALKVIKAGLDTKEVVARFETERQALALMDHPGIARVYEGGATERGRPWFAMELVDGPRITEWCERRQLGVVARLELFLEVCRAVQHAHQKGVIHRDLKPSNVLVTEVDGRAVPKVIDFGIAKATDARLTEKTLLTREGQVIGTPAYMSPEQVGEGPDVDTRADVYSLGVLLYELLSGATPFEPTTLREAGLAEVLRIIREVDPPKPSTRLRATLDAGTVSRVLPRHVRGDLDWIVMRCLEKDRERRYDSVSVLANEVERHQRGEPVLAGPPSVAYRVAKLVRRHRTAVVFLFALLLALVGGIAATAAQARRARAAEREARTELVRAGAVAEFLEHVLLSIDPAVAQGQDRTLLRLVLERAQEQVEARDDPAVVEATLRRIVGGAFDALALPEQAEPELRAARDLRAAALGPDDPLTLDSTFELGVQLLKLGRSDEGIAELERCLAGRRAALGPEADDTLDAAVHLATGLHRAGRDEEAAALLLELEETSARVKGPDHPDTLLVTNNLADTLEDLGRYDEAEPRYRRALEVQRETLGETDPRTMMALNNLGSLYSRTGRLDEAEPLLQRALELKRTILEPDHPSVVISMNNLAEVQKRRGRTAEAEANLREALELARGRLGEEAGPTLTLRVNLARLLLGAGRPAEAEAVLVPGAALAPRDRLGATLLGWQAESLLALERWAEAEVPARRAAELAPQVFRAEDPSRGIARVRLAEALAGLGRADEARELFEQARADLLGLDADEEAARAARGLAQLDGAD